MEEAFWDGIEVREDGSLWWHSGPYLHYAVGETEATLDGRFTADELRQIAAHMERQRPA